MSDPLVTHIVVKSGPDAGRKIHVPEAGMRIGRSPQNDIELTDPAVSRFQCRVFFKPDGALWVSDLGSTNQTLVNEHVVLEQPLNIGDAIGMGDTILLVERNRREATPEAAPTPAEPPPAPVDLGLKPMPEPVRAPVAPAAGRPKLFVIAVAIGVLALAVVAYGVLLKMRRPGTSSEGQTAHLPLLDVSLEKVVADGNSIFRYKLELRERKLSVQLDSLRENRHVRKEKDVEEGILNRLKADLEPLGFFDLEELYEGVAPGLYELSDLSVTMGSRTHRAKVLNREQPTAFAKTREKIETFASHELELAAAELPPEKLKELGNEAVLLGKKLFGERDVSPANLFEAIRTFKEARWYAETLEPKPDFYAEAVAGQAECERALQESYEQYKFQANRSIKLYDWPAAQRHLQFICQIIPDRDDPRHREAAEQLLDVERRLRR